MTNENAKWKMANAKCLGWLSTKIVSTITGPQSRLNGTLFICIVGRRIQNREASRLDGLNGDGHLPMAICADSFVKGQSSIRNRQSPISNISNLSDQRPEGHSSKCARQFWEHKTGDNEVGILHSVACDLRSNSVRRAARSRLRHCSEGSS